MLLTCKKWCHSLLRYLTPGLFEERLNHSLYRFAKAGQGELPGRKEGAYVTASGVEVPIYSDYRYSLKQGWRMVPAMSTLGYLHSEQLLTDEEAAFFVRARGERAISLPIDEVIPVAMKAMERNFSEFLLDEGEVNLAVMPTPTQQAVDSLMAGYMESNSNMLKSVYSCRPDLEGRSLDVLEIGYVSGGLSLYALERLGHRVVGCDNYVDGSHFDVAKYPHAIRELAGAEAELLHGDIVEGTPFEDGSFDMIFSGSVLEHLQDLDAAFQEMNRLLKPGGLIVHSYGPFFGEQGGHALGIPDCPWGHVRMPLDEYKEYIRTERPYEADIAISWLEEGMNYASIAEMQRCVVRNGFDLLLWEQLGAKSASASRLTPEVMRDCFAAYPKLAVTDLLGDGAFFVAEKR